MPTAGVAGREINYERAGAGEPLLLIQGLSGTHLAWGEPFKAELESSFDTIAFDNRGVGRSGPVTEPFTIAEMAADAAGLLDALEVETTHVLGISMGGMIAQELALAHPERIRTLTLGCTYCGGEGSSLTDPADSTPLLEAMASGDRERVYRAGWELNVSPGFRAEEGRYATFQEMASALPVAQETIQLQLQAIFGHNTSDRLGDVALPTLVIHGTEDKVIPVANGHLVAGLIPGSRLEIYDGTGHLFWWEQPERSAGLIREHALAAASS
ncbi:MAG TPA: alpha/beta fold hydrolase [Solirubrobacterales bacterium]|nr:alpha/beta fold hydrolase [Solirubrobacterales bacterium]